jgi:outer membrane protein OmpA-like peptidoglycan-associated protein
MLPLRFRRTRASSPHARSRAATRRALRHCLFVTLLAAAGSLTICRAQSSTVTSSSIATTASDAVALGSGALELESENPSRLHARPENLGPAINSPATELGPVISPDGRTLYFTRGGAGGNQDIWFSHLDTAGTWTSAVRMPAPLTNPFNNFVESVTPDGNTLLVGGRYLTVNSIVTGLAVSHRTRDGWSVPEPLRIRNYYSRTRSVSSCLGSDGGTLVMSLERDGGRGRQDLYVSFRTGDEWTEPMSLGPIVNSVDIDFAPFLAADGVTLYFSSKGHGGYGDADIFVTRRLDSTWQRWSEPVNLGPTINSSLWDAYYVIPASGDYVYFGSVDNAIGESDLVRVGLPQAVRPGAVALVSGRVINSATQEPVEATIHYERLPRGEEAGTARTDPRTGSYAIALPAGEVYAFRAEAPGMLGVGSNVDLTSLGAYVEKSQDLTMVPLAEGEVVGLENIFFDFGQSVLRNESFPELNRLVDLMGAYPTLEIEVSGHTDGVGSATSNARLSEARVASVVRYLTEKGVDSLRLHTVPAGESHPIADNISDEGRQRNRRVEFRIVRR